MLKSYIRASEDTKPASELGMVCIDGIKNAVRSWKLHTTSAIPNNSVLVKE